MKYLVVRTSFMEVSAEIEAETPDEAAGIFDKMHEAAAPIVRAVVNHEDLSVEFEPMGQSVWDPDGGPEAEPLWDVDF